MGIGEANMYMIFITSRLSNVFNPNFLQRQNDNNNNTNNTNNYWIYYYVQNNINKSAP